MGSVPSHPGVVSHHRRHQRPRQARLPQQAGRCFRFRFHDRLRQGQGQPGADQNLLHPGSKPAVNETATPRKDVPTGRYRLSLEDRTNFTDDIYGIANITKLSDPFVMQDFYQGEFRIDPVPDNVVALTKTDPWYTLTGIARFQANEFFATTERLPEVVLDIKRHALFGGPIFYEGETGFADLRLQFPHDSGFENYGTYRFDTFHQLTFPNTYFGWLSIVPRRGFL